MSTQRLDLKVESDVIATDGPCGSVERLVIDPHDGLVSALIVLPYEPSAYPVLVPLDRVAAARDDKVWLTMSRAAVDELPLFDPERYKLPGELDSFVVNPPQAQPEGEGNIQPEPVQPITAQPVFVLHAGLRVLCPDGEAGHVTLLLADPRGQVRHFVLRTGQLAGRRVIIPIEWVREVDQNNVHLLVARSALEERPDYRPDREIADEAERVLWGDDVLCRMAYHQTDVAVHAGTVTVRGYVRTSTIKERVELAIRSVRGVLGVDNRIVADGELVNAVSAALARDSRLRGQTVYVQAREGFITLTGDVRDANALTAAELAVTGVPQMRGVINHVRALGVSD